MRLGALQFTKAWSALELSWLRVIVSGHSGDLNYVHHPAYRSDYSSCRRLPFMAAQPQLGYGPSGALGVILIIVLVVALLRTAPV
jgi:hypothetical protein